MNESMNPPTRLLTQPLPRSTMQSATQSATQSVTESEPELVSMAPRQNIRCTRLARWAVGTLICVLLLSSWNALAASPLQAATPPLKPLTAQLTAQPTPTPPNLAAELRAVEPLLPSLYLGLQLFPSMPKLVGLHGPQHYLLVVQNSDELRATGGFISALGVLTLDKGRIANLEFMDSYRLYQPEREYPPAPLPMQQWMGIHYLLFRDANWSPDLPTTAALMQLLYQQETGLLVDGIVTVDLHALQLVVGALAPIEMPGAPEPLTAENVLTQVKALWTQPEVGETITDVGLGQWWNQRKNFIPALAAAVMAKVQSGNINYVAMATAVEDALHERAIQIWLADESAAAQLATLGWDGSLRVQPDADYLSLIDTNMGYNKVNAAVERSLHYSVTWPTAGTSATATPAIATPAIATVTIEYRHPISLTDHSCDQTPRYGAEYQDLVERCFFNYVRLYVPAGSQLLATEGLQPDSIGSRRGEKGTQVFAGFFILPPGATTRVQFHYQLPATITREGYQLLLQRQSGSGPLPLSLAIANHVERLRLTGGLLVYPLE